MRITAIACALLIALSSIALPGAAAGASRTGKLHALDSTVQVLVKTRFGTTRRCSGFLFNQSGQVATSYHAISDAVSISVLHAKYGVFSVDRVRRANPRADLAVLNLVQAEGADTSCAYIADSRSVNEGDSVFIVHHSYGCSDAIYKSTILATGYPKQFPSSPFIDDFAPEMMLLQLDGPFDAGSAGGLVCNENYDVIGILLGGGAPTAEGRIGYALASYYFSPLLIGSYDVPFSKLETEHNSDAEFFDKFLGPSPQPMNYQAPMQESYIAWFAPITYSTYGDAEFTAEIKDNVDKNWFATTDLQIDGRPVNEWSAARLFAWSADTNPWGIVDGPDRYVYFDADSLFSKRIYKNRDTEERIVTRNIMVMAVPPGSHTISYVNKGANYKNTGKRSKRINLGAAEVEMIDIKGLNFVSWLLLPNAVPKGGEGEPVHYEVDKRPLGGSEVNSCIRMIRYPVEF